MRGERRAGAFEAILRISLTLKVVNRYEMVDLLDYLCPYIRPFPKEDSISGDRPWAQKGSLWV